jgi:Pyruvate/2-oxoacid:ferredoxin oxidoreductase delta subunit
MPFIYRDNAAMNLHFPSFRHDRTAFVEINTHLCTACKECNAVCPKGVLGQVAIFHHRHARVDHAAACKGCLRCIAACQQKAIRKRAVT